MGLFYCALCDTMNDPSDQKGLSSSESLDRHLVKEHYHLPDADNGKASRDNFESG